MEAKLDPTRVLSQLETSGLAAQANGTITLAVGMQLNDKVHQLDSIETDARLKLDLSTDADLMEGLSHGPRRPRYPVPWLLWAYSHR